MVLTINLYQYPLYAETFLQVHLYNKLLLKANHQQFLWASEHERESGRNNLGTNGKVI